MAAIKRTAIVFLPHPTIREPIGFSVIDFLCYIQLDVLGDVRRFQSRSLPGKMDGLATYQS